MPHRWELGEMRAFVTIYTSERWTATDCRQAVAPLALLPNAGQTANGGTADCDAICGVRGADIDDWSTRVCVSPAPTTGRDVSTRIPTERLSR